MAIKYGGKTTPDYSAMRGPCDKGFHVPMESERQTIKTAVETWWSGNGAGQVMALASYLKIPLGGYRQGSSGDVTGQGTSGRYWTCTGYSSTASRCYKIASSSTSWGNVYQALGCSIRPFKDIPVVPDSNWTVEHQGTGTAGIYSNATLGLISISSDGTNWVTIADKNIGATIVYSYADTFSESNCGKYFQRGNCYGFAWTGSITTSTTLVDTTNYGPGNYYYGSSFVRSSTTWASTDNRNLRGGVTGVQQKPIDIVERYYGGKLINDYSAMRGPCPKGYHVPSSDEWVALYNVGINLGARTQSVGAPVSTYLKMPTAGYRYFQTSDPGGTEYGDYWSCTLSSRSANNFGFSLNGIINPTGGSSCTNGLSIRPFKDLPVIPDGTWTTLYTSDAFPSSRNIKHSQSLGLITISYDGTYITIADKNLGATTVYNSGDTLSEANCGKFYQWGNNYGFPWAGTVTTSSTQVDTTGYGPGNYYSSSTFITSGTFPYDWSTTKNANLWGGETGVQQKPVKVIEVYYGSTKIWPIEKRDYYFSPSTFNEYQSLVDSVGSVQFVDTGRRFRFNDGVYIGNRTALDFDGTTMRTINLDTLTVASSKSSSISGRVWYFGDNRILTRMGIADFDGNMITTFSTTYNSITPGDVGVVWANSGFDIYKGIVDGDNITFTKIGTGGTDQGAGWMFYGKLGAYLINNHDTSGSGYSSYIDPESGTITNFGSGSSQRGRIEMSVSGPDGKLYRKCRRYIGWGLMQKIGTGNEGIVGNSLSTSWSDYGNRWGKFLGNIVSGGMNTNNGTGNGYGSNNYFIATDGTLTKVQDNAFAYDTGIMGYEGFIDENGRIYPKTYGGGTGVILKTDKTFTDLNWKNPYLWR